MMKKAILIATVALFVAPSLAHAQAGSWELVRTIQTTSPYQVSYSSLTDNFIASSPTLMSGLYGDLRNGARLPINTAPDGDFAALGWPVWRFGDFLVDGIPRYKNIFEPKREDFRTVTYRPLPRLANRSPVPYGSDLFDYGKLNIPVLNYSPDMVAGYPCDLSTLGGENPAQSLYHPKVWLEASGARAAGAALVASDPCLTQRAIELAVYALSHASPDRNMRDFMAGLEHIRRFADGLRYGVSDVTRMYRMAYVEQRATVYLARHSPLHGGNLFFLAPGHEGKRLYWLLLHPVGDVRLFPIGYQNDDDLLDVRRSNPPIASYWRPRLIGGGLSDSSPTIGRVGVRFALYSPDNALVCGRDIGYEDFVLDETGRVSPRSKRMGDFSHARCDFALGPHMRAGGTHFITAVVYLVWEPQQNTRVLDDIAIGSSLWSAAAGIDRYSSGVYPPFYNQAHLTPGMLLQRLLPAYSALGQQ